jgi:hypothetical protein
MASLRPVVGGLRIDIKALKRLAHRCDPYICKDRDSCCASYDIEVTRREASRVVGFLPEAARYAPRLRNGRSYLDPIEDMDDGPDVLATNEDGRCVLAYDNADGATLCSLHSAALDRGIPYAQVKPAPCCLWPLALSEDRPPMLTVQDDAYDFPCNSRRKAAAGLDTGVQEILREVFGENLLHKTLDMV